MNWIQSVVDIFQNIMCAIQFVIVIVVVEFKVVHITQRKKIFEYLVNGSTNVGRRVLCRFQTDKKKLYGKNVTNTLYRFLF